MCNIRCSFDQENMHLSSKGFRREFMFSLLSALWKLYLVPTALLCAANMMVFFIQSHSLVSTSTLQIRTKAIYKVTYLMNKQTIPVGN